MHIRVCVFGAQKLLLLPYDPYKQIQQARSFLDRVQGWSLFVFFSNFSGTAHSVSTAEMHDFNCVPCIIHFGDNHAPHTWEQLRPNETGGRVMRNGWGGGHQQVLWISLITNSVVQRGALRRAAQVRARQAKWKHICCPLPVCEAR